MLNLNSITLDAVVSKAMADAAAHPRWLTAIRRAVVELLSNPYLERQDNHLLIASPTSGKIYAANGVCQCEAYKYNRPCWHRAAARLVRLHDERQAKIAIDADLYARQAQAQALLDECYA